MSDITFTPAPGLAPMFSDEQLAQIKSVMRDVLREELSSAGLRMDSQDHKDDAREDFRFLRRIRTFADAFARGIGMWIIAGSLGILGWILTTAAGVWKHTP